MSHLMRATSFSRLLSTKVSFCYPPSEEIEKGLTQPGKKLRFMHWGLNDEGLKYLLRRISELNVEPSQIDLSYNALTDESMPLLKHAEDRGFSFRLDQ